MNLAAHPQPYIIGVAGFWSFNDELSKLRVKCGARNFSSDLTQWFALHYPRNPVKPLADNEWLAIMYSDGTMQWQVSPLNKARLKNLTMEQLHIGVQFFDQGGNLLPEGREILSSMPEPIGKAIASNFKNSLTSLEIITRILLQKAKMPALALAAAYWGYKGASATNSLHSYMKVYQQTGIKKYLSIAPGVGINVSSYMAFVAAFYFYGKKIICKTGRDVIRLSYEGEQRERYITEVCDDLRVLYCITNIITTIFHSFPD